MRHFVEQPGSSSHGAVKSIRNHEGIAHMRVGKCKAELEEMRMEEDRRNNRLDEKGINVRIGAEAVDVGHETVELEDVGVEVEAGVEFEDRGEEEEVGGERGAEDEGCVGRGCAETSA